MVAKTSDGEALKRIRILQVYSDRPLWMAAQALGVTSHERARQLYVEFGVKRKNCALGKEIDRETFHGACLQYSCNTEARKRLGIDLLRFKRMCIEYKATEPSTRERERRRLLLSSGFKTCPTCQRLKRVDAFSPKGFQCKACNAKRQREYRDNHPSYSLYQEDWKKKNRARVQRHQVRYREKLKAKAYHI